MAASVGSRWRQRRDAGLDEVVARRMVAYPIQRDRVRLLVNWVAEVRPDDGRPMPRRDWDHCVDRAEVHAHFADFTFDRLDVPDAPTTCTSTR